MGIFDNLFRPKGQGLVSSEVDMGEADLSESDYDFDVVGESFQRDHLIALLKKNKVIDVGQFKTQAMLELEPTNDFDPNAVKVMVDGLQVGYVPKTFSSDVTKLLKDKGLTEFQVPALLGWDSNNPMPVIGVRLDMSEFGL
jgi:hypothetical protein